MKTRILITAIAIICLCGCGKTDAVPAEETIQVDIVATPAELPAETTEAAESKAYESKIEYTKAETTVASESETELIDNSQAERAATLAKFLEIHANAIAGYTESGSEQQIISYLQIPSDLYGDTTWTGEWSKFECAGRTFSSFGCGICCLTNIYDTIFKPEVLITPDQMFAITREQTDYRPESGVGAVSWGQLKRMCDLFGLPATVKQKPADYAVFQNDVKNSTATLALVCRRDDDKLWFYTEGHYVTLWEYDEATDTVFVTDSSGLFNRARVSLFDVYNALKSASQAQYMSVVSPAQIPAEQAQVPEETVPIGPENAPYAE